MIDNIQGFGEFVVGLIAILIVGFVIVAGLIEFFDAVTGADKRKQAEKEHMDARLRSLEGEDS